MDIHLKCMRRGLVSNDVTNVAFIKFKLKAGTFTLIFVVGLSYSYLCEYFDFLGDIRETNSVVNNRQVLLFDWVGTRTEPYYSKYTICFYMLYMK